MEQLRWGILSTGNISRQFCTGALKASRSRLAAVGSRSEASARDFAATFGIPIVHGSYEALLADPSVQAIYNALPNTMHHEWTIKALRAGKHVLCEKPFAVNAAQTQEMFDVAQRQGLVLMEAFMYRTHPLTHAYAELVGRGEIGDVRLIRTSFCYHTKRIAGNIRFDPTLAGGAMMDVGCYCIDFARFFAGRVDPTRVTATAHIHETGVDDVTSGTMIFPNGIVASFTCAMSVHADNSAYISGSDGCIVVPIPWKPPVGKPVFFITHGIPPRMDLKDSKPQTSRTIEVNCPGELYGYEADDFATTILDGKPPRISPDDTIGTMKVLDTMRRQIGLPY